jgi:hypothetical protein
MSLQINTPLTTQQGIELATSYGRVAVVNNVKGDKLQAGVEIFASEAAFLAGAKPCYVFELVLGAEMPYDYSTYSKDILDLGHDLMISTLAKQGITAVKNL